MTGLGFVLTTGIGGLIFMKIQEYIDRKNYENRNVATRTIKEIWVVLK